MEIALESISKRLEQIEKTLEELRSGMIQKETLTIDEAAILTGYNKHYLYKLTHERRIPHYKCGRELRFDREELNQWMRSTRVRTDDDIASDVDTYNALRKIRKH